MKSNRCEVRLREKVRGRLRVPVVFGLKKSYFFFFFAAFFAGFFAAFFLVAMLSILPFHFSWNIAISNHRNLFFV